MKDNTYLNKPQKSKNVRFVTTTYNKIYTTDK